MRRRRHEADADDWQLEAPSPEALTAQLEAHAQLMSHVLALPEDARQVLVLRFYEDLSAADISRQMGIPAGTVRWRLKVALDQLRARLGADD